jgi:hypothetical protein
MATYINILFVTIAIICLVSVVFAGNKLVLYLNFVFLSIRCLTVVEFENDVLNSNIYFNLDLKKFFNENLYHMFEMTISCT